MKEGTPKLEPEGRTEVCSVETLYHWMDGWMEALLDACCEVFRDPL